MKKQILLMSILTFIALLSACGPQTTQTPLEPATPTEAPAQPTQAPASTDTPLPTSTTTPSADTPTEAPVANISFANDVMPIFNNSCNKCHGIEQIKEGLDMTTYEALMAGSFNGTVVTPGNAADSFLVQQVVEGEMPKRGPKLTAEQIQIITDWINAGAPNN
jgi:mono/diheme cytochrome c family protein